MTPPFRIGVMQLTMEPLEEMLEHARVMDRAGMDTIWLAEAYPWWRKHGMEARSSTVVSALMGRETERLTIGWGIISPFTRHPVQVAMDARVVQEAAPGRFILGFGTSKIFLNNARMQTKKTLGPMRDAVEIVRGVLGGGAFQYEGETWSADVPALQPEAETPREVPPVYVAATAPKMQALAGEIGDGCLTPSITTPAFVRYTRENVERGHRHRLHGRRVDRRTTATKGRDGAREIAGMYLANKVQNIQGAADTLLDLAGLEQDEIRPVAEAMERGGRLAAKAEVTDAHPRQVQADRRHAGRLHRRDRGVQGRRLHARHARALGRGPARADRAVRAGSAPACPGSRCVTLPSAVRLVESGPTARARAGATTLAPTARRGVADVPHVRGAWPARRLAVSECRPCDRGLALHEERGLRGASLMFNGHMDTSYSGREPWLRHVRGFQPDPFVQDGRLYGLGISNMKGALACYVEALRALGDAPLRGDVMIAAVCGEIEKTQYGDAQGAEYRGYAAGSRYLVTHGGVADMCVLGEPTEGKVVLGHFGSLWLRISAQGDFIHTAFSEGRRDRNSILRMREVLDAVMRVDPAVGGRPGERLPRRERDRQRRRDRRRLRLARLADAPPHRPLPRRARAADEADDRSPRRRSWTWCATSSSASRTTASRARCTSPRPARRSRRRTRSSPPSTRRTRRCSACSPERDVTRWFSDASALTRYGIPTVNYGTSTGLLDTVLGENLDIDGLVRTAEVYARIAQRICGPSWQSGLLDRWLPAYEFEAAPLPSGSQPRGRSRELPSSARRAAVRGLLTMRVVLVRVACDALRRCGGVSAMRLGRLDGALVDLPRPFRNHGRCVSRRQGLGEAYVLERRPAAAALSRAELPGGDTVPAPSGRRPRPVPSKRTSILLGKLDGRQVGQLTRDRRRLHGGGVKGREGRAPVPRHQSKPSSPSRRRGRAAARRPARPVKHNEQRYLIAPLDELEITASCPTSSGRTAATPPSAIRP